MTRKQSAVCPSEFVELAHKLADGAGPIIRGHFRTRLDVEAKDDDSPVTIADRDAELTMRTMINRAFPDHGIRGEEFGVEKPDAEWCWILDPIDGTKSFVSGSLCFGTQIGLTRRDMPVLGLIDQPITGERWVGMSGAPTLLGEAKITTSAVTELARAVVYTSGPEQIGPEQQAGFGVLCKAARFTRYSHDCYAAGLLALGMIDVLVEANLYEYDIVPQIPIIEGAGGIVTDWNGAKLGRGHHLDNVLMAANPDIHARAVEILRDQPGMGNTANVSNLDALF